MTTRFCTSCMTEVGLDPALSRLALPGCKSARMAYCDGKLHNCTVIVDEFGAVVRKSTDPIPNADYSLETILVAKPALIG